MNSSRYHSELVPTAAYTKILMEDTKGLGQRDFKGSKRDFFPFGSWLLSKKAVEAAASVGVDSIGTVKTNAKGFFQAMIEVLTKYWPGGSYIMLRSKPMVPW